MFGILTQFLIWPNGPWVFALCANLAFFGISYIYGCPYLFKPSRSSPYWLEWFVLLTWERWIDAINHGYYILPATSHNQISRQKCVCLQFLVHPTNLLFDFDIPSFGVLMVGTLKFEIKFVEMNTAVLIVFKIRNEFLIHSLLLMPSSAQALCYFFLQ